MAERTLGRGTRLSKSSTSTAAEGLSMDAKSLLVLLVRTRMRGLAMRLSRKYRDLVDEDEIFSAVDLALLRAVHRFDSGRGCFIGFATIWVRREVFQLIRRELTWRRRRVGEGSLIEPISFDSPHDEAERSQIARLIDGGRHAIWRAYVGDGQSVRELAASHRLSLRQVQTAIARSQCRLSKTHAPKLVRRAGRSSRCRAQAGPH